MNIRLIFFWLSKRKWIDAAVNPLNGRRVGHLLNYLISRILPIYFSSDILSKTMPKTEQHGIAI